MLAEMTWTPARLSVDAVAATATLRRLCISRFVRFSVRTHTRPYLARDCEERNHAVDVPTRKWSWNVTSRVSNMVLPVCFGVV